MEESDRMDIISYLMGLITGRKQGSNVVVLEGGYVFTDPNNDGNIIVTKGEDGNG